MQDTLQILTKFQQVRQTSEDICKPLEIDDYNMQAMEYGSPPKWNLGHCTWAFEAFCLSTISEYKPHNEKYAFCFNSYYETVGERIQRIKRHLLSRPTVNEVYLYRKNINEIIESYLTDNISKVNDLQDFLMRMEIAINHEEQHQELFFTDLKHIFFSSPLQPTYLAIDNNRNRGKVNLVFEFMEHPEVITEIGHREKGFSYDNEKAAHKVLLNPFKIMNRPVTNGEYREFVESKGYKDFKYWLSDAWFVVQRENWKQPLYWEKRENEWYEFTLHGFQPLLENAPVTNLSYYEADAYAKFKGCRLPTEFEWEYCAVQSNAKIQSGHYMEDKIYHPVEMETKSNEFGNFAGNTWEWTQSAYLPYPHFKTPPGALAEYNGKFMNDQRVLRGGSCVTPRNHIRYTYRNFFQSELRWQFAGFRLAKDC